MPTRRPSRTSAGTRGSISTTGPAQSVPRAATAARSSGMRPSKRSPTTGASSGGSAAPTGRRPRARSRAASSTSGAISCRAASSSTRTTFSSSSAKWTAAIADVRRHGTTHERPIDRFARERDLLLPHARRPSFQLEGARSRIVADDYLVSLDTNRYAVPFRRPRRRNRALEGCSRHNRPFSDVALPLQAPYPPRGGRRATAQRGLEPVPLRYDGETRAAAASASGLSPPRTGATERSCRVRAR